MNKAALTQLIKETAIAAGFDDCGVAQVAELSGETKYLQRWISGGYHAGMAFMERNIDRRGNPALLVDGAKSVVMCLVTYKPPHTQPADVPQVAYFAYGRDYHDWLHEKLNAIIDAVKTNFPVVQLRGFVDSAPVFEKAWAVRAGLGWIGKNNLLISPRFGSFVFISALLLDVELEYDTPAKMPSCGACCKCLDACPTNALREPYLLDANRCIAYQTIENKGDTTTDTYGYCFGCDHCQRVCPWNNHTPAHSHNDWPTVNEIISYTTVDWQCLDETTFNRIFAASPIKRPGFRKLQLNLATCNCKPL